MKDVMYGFDGSDTIYGLEADDTIYGGDGNDFLSGGANNDSLFGAAGNDTILGDSGNDTIDGGQGSDYLLGGNGDDAVMIGGNSGLAFSTYADGGAGTNTLTISYAGVTKLSDFVSRAFVNAGAQTLDGSFTLVDANGGTIDFKNFGYDSSNARYALTVGATLYYFNPIGGVFGDTLASSHASSGVSNKGAAYSASGGEVALFTTTQASTSGFDGTYTTQMGSPSALQISGSTGRDLIKGSAGADTIHGNAGNDEIYAVGVGNSVYGDAGNDVIFLAATSELSSNTVVDGGVGQSLLLHENTGERGGALGRDHFPDRLTWNDDDDEYE
jgi:Ca2+-binding RTX toxin-like protein